MITLSHIQHALAPLFDKDVAVTTRQALVNRPVHDIMRWEPATVGPEDPVQKASARMPEHKVSGLPVVNDNHVVGIITESDIFKLIVDA